MLLLGYDYAETDSTGTFTLRIESSPLTAPGKEIRESGGQGNRISTPALAPHRE